MVINCVTEQESEIKTKKVERGRKSKKITALLSCQGIFVDRLTIL